MADLLLSLPLASLLVPCGVLLLLERALDGSTYRRSRTANKLLVDAYFLFGFFTPFAWFWFRGNTLVDVALPALIIFYFGIYKPISRTRVTSGLYPPGREEK